MRKSWLLAVALLLTTIGLSAQHQPPEPVQQPSSYAVASAEDPRRLVQAETAARASQDVRSPNPGTLPLLFVGSLLLGLAAAVRRTT